MLIIENSNYHLNRGGEGGGGGLKGTHIGKCAHEVNFTHPSTSKQATSFVSIGFDEPP